MTPALLFDCAHTAGGHPHDNSAEASRPMIITSAVLCARISER